MSQPNTQVAKREQLAIVAARIDEASKGAVELFKQAGSFAAELAVAQTMSDLRAMLTDDVMQPIMALMNTDLGFVTDRDPKKAKEQVTPYSVAVVRECFIESKLRGFHTVGNEWNIIAGKFYAAKNGFRRKLTDGKSFPGLSHFRDSYDVPRLVGDKGAIVKCRATWKLNGVDDNIEREFPIKVNNFMGSDAILGKAERKLCKAVHDRIAGVITPEAEVGEEGPTINVDATSAPAGTKADFGSSTPKQQTQTRSSTATSAATPRATVPPSADTSSSATGAQAGDLFHDDMVTQEIRQLMEADGISEAELLSFARTEGLCDEAAVSINEINDGIRRNVIIRAWPRNVKLMREARGGAQ